MLCAFDAGRVALVAGCVWAALGCGSSGDDGATLPPSAGGSGSSGESSSGGAPTVGVIEPLQPGGTGASGSGVVGLVDDEAAPEAACVDQFSALTQIPPVIQFVVDTSGSMNWVPGTERLPDTGELSKWEITEQALATAIAGMPDAAAVGISYYPNTNQAPPNCIRTEASVPIDRLTDEQRALIERVNSARIPAGGTPTHAAYEFGVQQLEITQLAGARFLVLITDGIPTYTRECDGDGQTRVDGAPLVASVEQTYQESDIRTFVIGSPGSEPARDELSQMALVGGTGAAGCDALPGSCHFDMTSAPDFTSALNGALGDIAEATLGCDYAVPPAPTGRSQIDLNQVSVVLELGGSPIEEFARAASSDCEAGWQYNADQTSIVLCRSTCEELTRKIAENPEISVRVKFGCSITPT
jgi:von Willebrand factor type A domain-containing protein